MSQRKFIATILCLSLFFNALFVSQRALAYTTFAAPNIVPEIGSATGTYAVLGKEISKSMYDTINNMLIMAAKVAALYIAQRTTQAIIGKGSGDSHVVTDWNNYLFTSPQQKATTQMNSFFNTVSKGRLSAVNYEGIGPRYDSYLVAQAKQAIGGQAFSTNLQDIVTDPNQLFDGGNMKGLMTYMQCANNVACYTLTAQNQYSQELSTATEIAKQEQVNGFLPIKTNGRITQPASIVSSALSQVDQLGTQVIMNADAKTSVASGLMQIGAGIAINVASRTLQYSMADKAGKAAIQGKNDQSPISSFSYSSSGGFGVNVGGANYTTGLAAIGASAKIGNTAASGGVVCTGVTCDTISASQKQQGPEAYNLTGASSSATAPTGTATAPSITTR